MKKISELNARKEKADMLLIVSPEELSSDLQINEYISLNEEIAFLNSLNFLVATAPKSMNKEKVLTHLINVLLYLQNKGKISKDLANSYFSYIKKIELKTVTHYKKELNKFIAQNIIKEN